ncbi:MAG: lipid-binding SYLF domain-containing protein [Akkermansiaceae bacterium]|jgi:lipid-binding SYLF domain-containing protein|nr:lipid-binding SYLF domain-containing protein [Akkermansiaceae bacterium]
MNTTLPRLALITAAALAFMPGCATNDPVTRTNAANASASQITRDSRTALRSLYAQNRGAKALGTKARAVLVFPSVTRAGFMVGGQAGNGAMLRRDGSVGGFYQTVSASWGLQAGVQRFGYALFLMDDAALRNLNRSGGWEVGGSPSLVIVDQGMATQLSTNTINSGTYAFFFDQRGLMAGLGLQGTKITRINPGR